MINWLNNWKGTVVIDGTQYQDVPSGLKITDGMCISLIPKEKVSAATEAKADDKVYKVTVRQYMTKPATEEFDFMKKWNNDTPMPLRTMVGTIEKETPGMYKMNLHADITQDKTFVCMKCGRNLDNPVSQYFGMGPECGGHNYTNPFDSDEALKEAVANYRKELQKIKWNGWIIKKAIIEMEEIKND